jgi:Pyruvate/2-oxoacid:ferredoxin oxidoreductase delta subunit
MAIEGKRVLVCDCEGTMPLDGKALAKACGAGPDKLATQLCGTELGRFVAALKDATPLIVACTQEAPRFEEQREAARAKTPVSYVDIRAAAGWSDEARAATPKIAALLHLAAEAEAPVPTLTLRSEGVTLIYGKDQLALEAADRLKDTLNVTVLLEPGAAATPPSVTEVPVVQGRIRTAKGHLGAFELVVDDYAIAAPSSRAGFAFGASRDGARSKCDLILDLSGGSPLFPAHETRDGYRRPDPGSAAAVDEAIGALAALVGEFEKPRYVEYRAELCAHSRSRKTGCTRCLDLCPTGAIAPAGDHVAIDPHVCAGCGSCAAVCPTAAASYALPGAAALAGRARTLIEAFHGAGGRDAVLLVHDSRHGTPLIDLAARTSRGLPARVLPLAVNEVTQLGLDFFAAAIALGAAGLRLLLPAKPRHDLAGLAQQLGLSETLLAGLGFGGGRVGLIETDDPEALSAALYALDLVAAGTPRPFLPLGDKRGLTRLALAKLHEAAPAPVDVLALPKGAPFGGLAVNVAGCTLCLACVPACPTGALADNPERPMLRFTEDACVQCGLCKNTCPEKVIELAPRLDFRAAARAPATIKQEEPACCIRCGKAFGTKSTVDRVIAKLAGTHWMYGQGEMVDRMRMCADCRVIAQSESKLDPYAGPPRPFPRTMDETEALHDRPPDDNKPKPQ